jgi:hypothetical protein
VIAHAGRGLALLPEEEACWRHAARIGLAWGQLLEGYPAEAEPVLGASGELVRRPPTIGDAFVLAEVSRLRGISTRLWTFTGRSSGWQEVPTPTKHARWAYHNARRLGHGSGAH